MYSYWLKNSTERYIVYEVEFYTNVEMFYRENGS